VMVSKLGGLSTFEAFSCHLPIIADTTTKPMPQEAGTVSLVAKRGAGILLEKTTDIVPIIKTLLQDSKKYDDMKDATAKMIVPNSTQNIIREITALLPKTNKTAKTDVLSVRT